MTSTVTDATRLADRLKLHPPSRVEEAPATLSFERSRHITLPWLELAGEIRDLQKAELESRRESIGSVRQYLERSWGLGEEAGTRPSSAALKKLLLGGYILDATYVAPTAATDEMDATERERNDLRSTTSHDGFARVGEDQAIKSGLFVRHGTTRKVYLLHLDPETPPRTSFDLRTSAGYTRTWDDVIDIELVVDRNEDANRSAPTVLETIDMRAPFIEQRYRELIVLAKIAVRRRKEASAGITDEGQQSWSPAEFDEAAERLIDAELGLHRIERDLQRLVRQAAEMGYRLYVEQVDGALTVEAPPADQKDVNEDPVLAGKLYRYGERVFSWTPTFPIQTFVGWLFPTLVTRVIKLPPITLTTRSWTPVDTTIDPHVARIDELKSNGLPQSSEPAPKAPVEGDTPAPPPDKDPGPVEIHVCVETEAGYVTEDGLALEQVMLQCSLDEELRQRTSVFIPVYDVSLSGRRLVVSYLAFHRPTAGTTPIAFPELDVVESLTYRTAWERTEVGELVKAVNLAPGERRTITVSRAFEQESTTATTSSSVFDLASTDSSDLSTELERTLRTESELSAKASATVSGKAKWGWGSAEGSATASGETSLKDMSNSIAKSAQKAARSVSEQRREEVSTNSTSRTTVTTSETSEATIENVNKGRTLNLFFHRIYNRFTGQLVLNNLRLNVRSGVELIAGSGIRSQRSYSIHEIEAAIEELSKTPIPMKITDDDQWRFRTSVLRAVSTLVLDEYHVLTESLKWGEGFEASIRELIASVQPTDRLSAPTDDPEQQFRQAAQVFEDQLAPMQATGVPINKTPLLVAASGLYLESHVGTLPATEPYSERMRDAAYERELAEIEQLRADAQRKRTIAQRMPMIDAREGAGNEVVDIATAGSSLSLSFAAPLGDGPWLLEHAGRAFALVGANADGRTEIDYEFADSVPEWVANKDFALLQVLHANTGQPIPMARVLADSLST